MAQQTHTTEYQYSLLNDQCKLLNLQGSMNPSYLQSTIRYQSVSHLLDNHVDCRHIAAVEKADKTYQSMCGAKHTLYSKVHPKKKIRMTYDKEIADAHLSLASSSDVRDNTNISPCSSSSNFPNPYLFNQNIDESSIRRLQQNPVQLAPTDNLDPSVTRIPKLIPINHLSTPNPAFNSHPPRPQVFPSPHFVHNAYKMKDESTYSRPRRGFPAEDSGKGKPEDIVASIFRNSETLSHLRSQDIAPIIDPSSDQDVPSAAFKKGLFDTPPDQDKDVPSAAYKKGIFDSSVIHNRRTSREVLSPHSSHNSTNIVPNSPDCSSNCSSGYTDHYSTPNNQRTFPVSTPEYHPTADTKWRDVDPYQPINGFETLPKSRQPSIPQPYDDTDVCRTYLRKPIEEWTYEDVIFFVMEACKELGIHMNGVIFRSSDNGLVLLRMTPNDFELRAPNQGQRLYDYFINFKMQHFVASDQGIQHNPFQHMDHHAPPESYMYPSHHYNHQEPLPDIPQPFDHFQSSPGHSSHTTDSPLNEYVPQGYHYMEPLNDGVLRNGYDIPSAAAKIFPPLHSYEEPHSDTDEVEDEPTPEPPKKRGPGRPPKPESERKRKPKKNGKLWEFIRNLLLDPKTCPSLVRWEDALRGEFRIVQSDAIATKWGMRKNNEKMNYEKLSRAMRYYYKAKIFETVPGKRLVYKFGINAKGWRPLNINNPNFQN